MSIHAVNPELQARLAAQKRNSTIAGIVVGLLIMALLGLIFWAFKIFLPTKETEAIVSYQSEEVAPEQPVKQKVTNQVKKKPSSPSSSAVTMVTANAPSEISLPTPEVEVDTLSVDFGESEGFGDGWGSGSGSGFGGSGAGAFTFMGQKSLPEKVCFIIDWSESMDNMRGRFELLQHELLKSLEAIPDGTEFQMIMFAGPMWLATDEFDPNSNTRSGGNITIRDTVTRKTYKYKGVAMSRFEQQGGAKRKFEWREMDESYRKALKKFVNDGQLSLGTYWGIPLETALNMKPAPKSIIFLTDGLSGGADRIAQEMGDLAAEKKIPVKTIALMEPKAKDAMMELARLSKGSFTLVTGTEEEDREVTDFSGSSSSGIKKRGKTRSKLKKK